MSEESSLKYMRNILEYNIERIKKEKKRYRLHKHNINKQLSFDSKNLLIYRNIYVI